MKFEGAVENGVVVLPPDVRLAEGAIGVVQLAQEQFTGEPRPRKRIQFPPKNGADARVELGIVDQSERYRFVVESKSISTPAAIRQAIDQANRFSRGSDEYPLIQVPFLSRKAVRELEAENASSVDLCGNGVVIVPGRIYVVRTGHLNQYRDSRPLNNPFRGRSAMVARMLLIQPRWDSLTTLVNGIKAHGLGLSMSQVSKAVAALADELIVGKTKGMISLNDPLRLLDQLSIAWRKNNFSQRQYFRIPDPTDWPARLSSNEGL